MADQGSLPGQGQLPLDIFDALYGQASEDAIIALGSRRPLRNNPGGDAPHYLVPVQVKDRHEMLPEIFKYCVNQTQYLMPNTLTKHALHEFKRESNSAEINT